MLKKTMPDLNGLNFGVFLIHVTVQFGFSEAVFHLVSRDAGCFQLCLKWSRSKPREQTMPNVLWQALEGLSLWITLFWQEHRVLPQPTWNRSQEMSSSESRKNRVGKHLARLCHISIYLFNSLNVGTITIPISQMRQLRHKEFHIYPKFYKEWMAELRVKARKIVSTPQISNYEHEVQIKCHSNHKILLFSRHY